MPRRIRISPETRVRIIFNLRNRELTAARIARIVRCREDVVFKVNEEEGIRDYTDKRNNDWKPGRNFNRS